MRQAIAERRMAAFAAQFRAGLSAAKDI